MGERKRGAAPAAEPVSEIAAEQAHIDRAYARLAVTRRGAAGLAETLSPGERGGAHQERLLRAAAIEVGRRRLEALLTDGSALCFGRIDTDEADAFHIGRVGVADEGGDQLVVDWRAPVAEPFYRATGLSPMGLRRRRHIRTRDGRVVALDDEWLDASAAPSETGLSVVGEAALFAAVTRTRSGRMRDIVATIQAEQDRVVRAPMPGLLVVAGGPGTGKTAVALHRAAYLLYTHRVRLERVGVLVVGPNPVFLRYIERVLPSLDEEAVVLATPAQLYGRIDGAVVEADGSARRVKGDRRMAAVLERAVRLRQRPLREAALIPFGASQLEVTRAMSRAIVERARQHGGPHNEGHTRVRRMLASHLHQLHAVAMERRSVDDEMVREPMAFADFAERVQAERAFRVALERMWPALTAERFLSELYTHPALLRGAADGELTDHELQLLARPPSDAAGSPWTVADVPLLDEAATLLGPMPRRRKRADTSPVELAWFMADRVMADLDDIAVGIDSEMAKEARDLVMANIEGPRPEQEPAWPREFAHIVVDEAQELSAMQWRMLARRCPSGSFTVAGDLSQASGGMGWSDWGDALAELPGAAKANVVELTVNYRTPSEVMDVASAILAVADPKATPPRSLRSSGIDPVVIAAAVGEVAAAAEDAVLAERAATTGTVGVIAPRALLARVSELAERHKETAQAGAEVLDGPITVLTLAEAKGLEFDSIVLVEPAALVDEAADGLAALYVALTRTTSRLVIVHEQPLPPVLQEALAPRG